MRCSLSPPFTSRRSRPDLAIELLDRVLAAGASEHHVTVPLLVMRVEAQLAQGDIDAARRSSDELREIAADAQSTYVRAAAAATRARLCGRPATATHEPAGTKP